MSEAGVLFLVATPIGNLDDMTLRALDVLRGCERIACEDTRRTRKLLTRFDIHKPLLSIPSADEKRRARRLAEHLEKGERIAFVSDAGTPGISDPGELLVAEALAVGAAVIPIPGASAHVAAVAVSGLPASRFCFLGFLPRKRKERKELLDTFGRLPAALVFHEAPTRIAGTLEELATELGDERAAVVCRELTKLHEEISRGTLRELACRYSQGTRGELTVVVGPPTRTGEDRLPLDEALELIDRRVSAGERLKDACREVAKGAAHDARALYRAALDREGR